MRMEHLVTTVLLNHSHYIFLDATRDYRHELHHHDIYSCVLLWQAASFLLKMQLCQEARLRC